MITKEIKASLKDYHDLLRSVRFFDRIFKNPRASRAAGLDTNDVAKSNRVKKWRRRNKIARRSRRINALRSR